MGIISKHLLVIAIFLILCSCSQSGNNAQENRRSTQVQYSSDSIELLTLARNLLKWNERDKDADFLPTSDNDSIYTGIDWNAHKTRVEELSKTNLFSQEFIDTYQKIALQLDRDMKQSPIKYYKGDLPPYANDANAWCNCQDYPSDIWDRLTIKDIKQEKERASFYWTWGDDLNYFIKVKKEDGHWRITYLEGFDIKNYTWK